MKQKLTKVQIDWFNEIKDHWQQKLSEAKTDDEKAGALAMLFVVVVGKKYGIPPSQRLYKLMEQVSKPAKNN
jgi:hypothetical protein